MERRPLGRTGLAITPIGLGAWAIGGGDWCLGWGPQDDQQSIATIRRALDRGINWIDTAAVYGLGRSEALIARALRGVPRAARPFVFTTCGFVWDDLGNVARDLTPASIRRGVDASLRRLGVDAIDLYQLDATPVDEWIPSLGGSLEEAWEALASLHREGKVRAVGITGAGSRQIALLDGLAPAGSVQAAYSLLRRGIEDDLLPYCAARGIGVLAASPMASGLLTGAMTPDRVRMLPHNDWRRCSPWFQPVVMARAAATVDRLRAVAARQGVTPGAVAVAWTLHGRGVTAAVVGARRPEQVDGLVPAVRLRLTPGDLRYVSVPPAVRFPASPFGTEGSSA